MEDDEPITYFDGVGFDDVSMARLMELSEKTKVPPRLLIASIVKKVLEDDYVAECSRGDDDTDTIYRKNANKDLH